MQYLIPFAVVSVMVLYVLIIASCLCMKLKATILSILLSLATLARADLIDLDPGGYQYSAHGFAPPASLLQLINDQSSNLISFFDEATPDGWVSLYGVLNGGTLFNTSLTGGGPLAIANVSWNFVGTPYNMRYLDVFGTNNGDPWENVYLVTGNTRFNSGGLLNTELDGSVIITGISFYGFAPGNIVPDGGVTALMFGSALLGLLWFRRQTDVRH